MEEEPEEITPEEAEVSSRIIAIRPELLLGMRPGSEEVEDHGGSRMDEDTEQLILQEEEEESLTAPIVAGGLSFGFCAGFGFELLRFRKLLKRG